jgi:hypothetical protein
MNQSTEYLRLIFGSATTSVWPGGHILPSDPQNANLQGLIAQITDSNASHFAEVESTLRGCFSLLGEDVPAALSEMLDCAHSNRPLAVLPLAADSREAPPRDRPFNPFSLVHQPIDAASLLHEFAKPEPPDVAADSIVFDARALRRLGMCFPVRLECGVERLLISALVDGPRAVPTSEFWQPAAAGDDSVNCYRLLTVDQRIRAELEALGLGSIDPVRLRANLLFGQFGTDEEQCQKAVERANQSRQQLREIITRHIEAIRIHNERSASAKWAALALGQPQ